MDEDRVKSRADLRRDLIRYFDDAFPKIQQDRWPFTIDDLADGIMATIGEYQPQIDVDRLTRAVKAADFDTEWNDDRDIAEAIAAEYGRDHRRG